MDDEPCRLQRWGKRDHINIEIDCHDAKGQQNKTRNKCTEISEVAPEQRAEEHRNNQRGRGQPKLKHVGPGNTLPGNPAQHGGREMQNPGNNQKAQANALEHRPRRPLGGWLIAGGRGDHG